MPEHFLYHTEIRPSLNKMRRKGMAESVGRDPLGDTGPLDRPFDNFPKTHAGEFSASAVENDDRGSGGVPTDVAGRQIFAKSLLGILANRDQALLAALTQYPYEAGFEFDIGRFQVDQFRKPQSTAIEDLQNGAVTKGTLGFRVNALDDALDFRHREIIRMVP